MFLKMQNFPVLGPLIISTSENRKKCQQNFTENLHFPAFQSRHSLIIYTISGNRIVSGPKSFVSYQILLQIDPINPLGLVSG